ncbi:acetolactate synthase, catabolic [Enterococcus faecium EnGen0372]|uniref:acetolactate synthase AlsS n=1 Tax=Enterococcus faecium TaxID=1352 RepID=UPI00032F232E|nr:acetolactate synthase AlsS [Enterococcus faecium]EOG04123.1 acetolactate synthase, catabolic [Enterococcus faecium EnGen0171]EOK13030.1 acetolactate synthase, catabolic [Enterococcus faecium EnGen0372]EOM40301.1 acetolactate synthase, catabolic [Enterococcus faecium EnGen0172]MDT2317284.1 acetolactate synthase AlsS [Enterococcus faecium]NMP65907.1 acetolactate synthase AlsS [Enterococcus faecium]
MAEKMKQGSKSVVESLVNHHVDYVFGIPGAKIDGVFNELEDQGPELIVTRHEQNAAFMAQAIGRITGEPGVVIATSGPGASNLATGLVTATAEGDPVLAIAGQVKRSDLLKLTHQSMDNAALFQPITKYSAEIQDPETISEVIANAYRMAKSSKKGASFISIPQDVVDAPVQGNVIKPLSDPKLGSASADDIRYLAERIREAKLPVLLVGMRGSSEKETLAIRQLVEKTALPVVETFQAAGVISRELEAHFFGRVGLFRNQPGDMLLKRSDLVIAIGYDPIEYEARNWNAEKDARIIVIDEAPAEIDPFMQPERELIGDISATLDLLTGSLEPQQVSEDAKEYLASLQAKLTERDIVQSKGEAGILHPLEVINTLQSKVTDDMTVTVDVGSHYIWMARHFRSYEPRHLLFSNGMQTLGVALPWAISAALVRPNTQIVSVSGDGGFLFSAQDLETAVRKKLNIVHLIWNDGHYNMVEFQEKMKYQRASGVDFGPVDFVKYAEAFGAKGIRATSVEELEKALEEGFATDGPVIIDIPIDYRDNEKLGETILPDQFY